MALIHVSLVPNIHGEQRPSRQTTVHLLRGVGPLVRSCASRLFIYLFMIMTLLLLNSPTAQLGNKRQDTHVLPRRAGTGVWHPRPHLHFG